MSDIKQTITEEQHQDLIKGWYKARPGSPAELADFVKHLVDDYQHDYGTICHAVAAAGLAAMRTVDANPANGGITGFQASIVIWEVIRGWGVFDNGPKWIQTAEKLCYPQYSDQFATISLSTWTWVQKHCKAKLDAIAHETDPFAHSDVITHWKKIVAGEVPFGLTVVDR
jgi:hypothetical protein